MSEVKMLSLFRMEYKGFFGDINYDMETNTYSGSAANLEGDYSIQYLAKTIYNLKEAFAKAVDEYLMSNRFIFAQI